MTDNVNNDLSFASEEREREAEREREKEKLTHKALNSVRCAIRGYQSKLCGW